MHFLSQPEDGRATQCQVPAFYKSNITLLSFQCGYCRQHTQLIKCISEIMHVLTPADCPEGSHSDIVWAPLSRRHASNYSPKSTALDIQLWKSYEKMEKNIKTELTKMIYKTRGEQMWAFWSYRQPLQFFPQIHCALYFILNLLAFTPRIWNTKGT